MILCIEHEEIKYFAIAEYAKNGHDLDFYGLYWHCAPCMRTLGRDEYLKKHGIDKTRGIVIIEACAGQIESLLDDHEGE